MSYKGIKKTSQKQYIFKDTYVYNPEFDLEELKNIQKKLEDYISGKSSVGITPVEAELFLDWITFNARCFATRKTPESALTASMKGQCAATQRLNYRLLNKMGLDVLNLNVSDCIGKKLSFKHSVSLVCIPITENNGNTYLQEILLDPTFRQFCLKDNCDYSKFSDVAPHPGYFMQVENLVKFGVPKEVAKKTEMLGKYLITKGYFYLNEENAKLYFDTFVRASQKLEQQDRFINISGAEYIMKFKNSPMKMLKANIDKSQYMRLPSEIKEKRLNLFLRVAKFFKGKFKGNKVLALAPGKTEQIHAF